MQIRAAWRCYRCVQKNRVSLAPSDGGSTSQRNSQHSTPAASGTVSHQMPSKDKLQTKKKSTQAALSLSIPPEPTTHVNPQSNFGVSEGLVPHSVSSPERLVGEDTKSESASSTEATDVTEPNESTLGSAGQRNEYELPKANVDHDTVSYRSEIPNTPTQRSSQLQAENVGQTSQYDESVSEPKKTGSPATIYEPNPVSPLVSTRLCTWCRTKRVFGQKGTKNPMW